MTAKYLPKIRQLRLKIIVPLVVLSLLGSLAAFVVVTRIHAEHVHQQVKLRAAGLANAIARTAESLGDTAPLRRIVAALDNESDVDLILVVLGESRHVVASNRTELIRFKIEELDYAEAEEAIKVLDSGRPLTKYEHDESHLVYIIPVNRLETAMRGQTAAGAVMVVLDTADVERDTRAAAWSTIGQIFAGVTALYVLAFAALHKAILLPLSRLRRALEMRRQGDLGARAEVLSHDEIGELAMNLNETLDALAQKERQLTARMLQAKEAERLAHLNEERLQAVIDTAVDGVVITDAAGTIEVYNPACQRIFGYTAEEVLGRDIKMLMPEPYRDTYDQHLAGNLQTGKPKIVGIGREVEGLRKDGTAFPLDLSVSIAQHSGTTALVSIVRDISDRKAAEATLKAREEDLQGRIEELEAARTRLEKQGCELALARDDAEKANRAKSEFLAKMSHEIRTPLNGVTGMTGLLLDTDLSPEQRRFAETIMESGEALMTLLNDILDLSKIEAGKVVLEDTDFMPQKIIDSVVDLQSPQARAANIEIGAYVATDVPRWVRGDDGRLRQILLNLIGNAVKFTPAGGIAVEVTKVAERHNSVTLRFKVTDTGVGISPEAQPSLFNRFTQADNSITRKFGGTGLGLAICRELTVLMGGEIGVESAPGKGSTFWFTIPFKPPLRVASAAPAMALEMLAGKHVLVVDDNEINRRIFELQLRDLKMEPTCVPDADACLKCVREGRAAGTPFDVAILDYMMPEVDGIELGRRLRAEDGDRAMKLVLSSSSDISDERAAVDQNFDAELPKPIRPASLLMCMAEVYGCPVSETGAAAAREKPVPVADSRRILLAEDNKVNQMLAVNLLTKAGHRVDVVGNGVEAIDAVRRRPYDLVLMDVQMPEMDGLEATRRIRAMAGDYGGIPIIAMTANARPEDRWVCLENGMNDFITKPIDLSDMLNKVAQWTSGEPYTFQGDDDLAAGSGQTVTEEAAAALDELLAGLDELERELQG